MTGLMVSEDRRKCVGVSQIRLNKREPFSLTKDVETGFI